LAGTRFFSLKRGGLDFGTILFASIVSLGSCDGGFGASLLGGGGIFAVDTCDLYGGGGGGILQGSSAANGVTGVRFGGGSFLTGGGGILTVGGGVKTVWGVEKVRGVPGAVVEDVKRLKLRSWKSCAVAVLCIFGCKCGLFVTVTISRFRCCA